MKKQSTVEIINEECFPSSIRLTADFKINGINFFASADYIQGNSDLEFIEVFRVSDLKYFDEGTPEFEIGEDILCAMDIIKTLTL